MFVCTTCVWSKETSPWTSNWILLSISSNKIIKNTSDIIFHLRNSISIIRDFVDFVDRPHLVCCKCSFAGKAFMKIRFLLVLQNKYWKFQYIYPTKKKKKKKKKMHTVQFAKL